MHHLWDAVFDDWRVGVSLPGKPLKGVLSKNAPIPARPHTPAQTLEAPGTALELYYSYSSLDGLLNIKNCVVMLLPG